MTRSRHGALLAVALIVYLLLAGRTAISGYIWDNEAWFASPAFTLLHKGYLGTTILASKGTWMEGVDRHTYWIPPLYPLLQALWYRLFGFGLLPLRWLSIMAGAGAFLALCGVGLLLLRQRRGPLRSL